MDQEEEKRIRFEEYTRGRLDAHDKDIDILTNESLQHREAIATLKNVMYSLGAILAFVQLLPDLRGLFQ